MSFDNTPTIKLIELSNLLYHENSTIDDWKNEFDNENDIRKELIEMLVSDILDKGYDGENDYNSMYWFVRGLNIPSPKPLKRYIDSDDYLFNNLYKYKIQDNIHDFNRQRIHEKFNRDLHKKDSKFLDELMKHRNVLNEFNKKIPMNEDAMNDFDNNDFQLFNLKRMKSYKEFVEFQNQTNEQDELIEKIINRIRKSPSDWYIDFRKLNDYGKRKIIKPLIDVLKNVVSVNIGANDKYRFSYLINSNNSEANNKWRSFPLRPNSWTQLINGLRSGLLLDQIEINTNIVNFSNTAYDGEIYWYYFDAVQLKPVKGPEKKYNKSENGNNRPDQYNERNGKFFPYWNLSNIDLSRYQIFNKNDDYFTQRELTNILCVAFSLSKLLPEDVWRKTWLRLLSEEQNRTDGFINWRCNCHNSKHLNIFCKEFKIYCKLHYYDEYAIKKQFRIVERGVSKNESKYQIELAIYKEHFFIYEKTNCTRYFIQHYDELKDLKDPNKIIGKHKTGTYQRDSREKYCLNSLELLIEMMKNNLFESINFKDLYNLDKPLVDIYGNEVNDDTPITEIANLQIGIDGKCHIKSNNENTDEHYNEGVNENEDDDYNGFSESEIFGCKNNNYLMDDYDEIYEE